VGQVAFVAILILIPLIYTEALPKTMMATMLTAPPPPPPPPPPPAPAQIVRVKPQAHLMDAGKLVAPKVIPKDVKIIKEEAEPDMSSVGMTGGVPGGVAGGSMGGVLGGVIGGWAELRPSEAQVDGPAEGWRQRPGRAHFESCSAVYPPLARQTRISGTVRLHAIIPRMARFSSSKSSRPPLLQQKRAGCVRQCAISLRFSRRTG